MYRSDLILFSILLFFSFLNENAHAQFENDYTPMDSFDIEKEELINAIESDLDNFKKGLSRSERAEMMDIYEKKSSTLISLIESNYFINDKELSGIINEIYREIVDKNPREGYPVRLLCQILHCQCAMLGGGDNGHPPGAVE